MTEVAICCLVRDGISYLPSFRRQIESLNTDDIFSWHLFCIEGDSTDDSWSFLSDWAANDKRITLSRLDVGRASNKAMLAENWAKACNACLDLIPPDSHYTHVLWLESDLCFPPETLKRLLAHGVDAVAPIIYLGGYFYDTWGFRGLDGVQWRNQAPYHSDFLPNSLIPMQSVGSCVLFSRRILDLGIRMRGTYDNGLLVGMCHDLRAIGMRIWADTGTAILHPVDLWERQMWRPDYVAIETGDTLHFLSDDHFARKGIANRLPLLDPKDLIMAHRGFLFWASKYLSTTYLSLDVYPHSGSQRRYDMKVSPWKEAVEPMTGDCQEPSLEASSPDFSSQSPVPIQDPGLTKSSNEQDCSVLIHCKAEIHQPN